MHLGGGQVYLALFNPSLKAKLEDYVHGLTYDTDTRIFFKNDAHTSLGNIYMGF
jgi:hypothetical protein